MIRIVSIAVFKYEQRHFEQFCQFEGIENPGLRRVAARIYYLASQILEYIPTVAGAFNRIANGGCVSREDMTTLMKAHKA